MALLSAKLAPPEGKCQIDIYFVDPRVPYFHSNSQNECSYSVSRESCPSHSFLHKLLASINLNEMSFAILSTTTLTTIFIVIAIAFCALIDVFEYAHLGAVLALLAFIIVRLKSSIWHRSFA